MEKRERRSLLVYVILIAFAICIFMRYERGEVPAEESTTQTIDWNEDASSDSGKIALTPGVTSKSLNFAWYSFEKGTPAVRMSTSSEMKNAVIYKGSATSIYRKNWKNTYKASNKISIENRLKKHRTYYYCYTDNVDAKDVVWSKTYSYRTHDDHNFQVAVLGDVQIGAYGYHGEGTANDTDIKRDTKAFQQTLNQVMKKAPNVSFFMSVGDQTNCYRKNSEASNLVRECEYAGFLYPSVLRSVPIATTVGNHDSKGTSYQYHFNNPNSSKELGKTRAGCDYYYRYGNTLFVVLNSNKKSVSQHSKILKEAIEKNKGVKWKVVMFHHDIYGSGFLHSNTDSKRVRKWLAPLMDQYKIDVCLSGHDHSYARSYQMKAGKIYKYKKKLTVKNPKGTLYLAVGTSTGSKYYKLAKKKQSYVAQRRSKKIASFSILHITNQKFTIRTFDANGKTYANKYTIKK